MPRLFGLLLLMGLYSGCAFRAGTAQTVLTVGSSVGGVGELHNKACLWMIGTAGAYRGMMVMIAQGDATLEECRKVQPLEPLHVAPPLVSPTP